jgi:GTP-binding protein
VIIGTKADRISNNALGNSLRTLKSHFGTDAILPYSTKTGAGRNDLWRRIGQACGFNE